MSDTERSAANERLHKGLTLAERRQQRREALIDTALELFGTKGYGATSVEEICRTAYVSTRNFYEEFENREALLMALGDRLVEDVFTAVMRVQVDAGSGPDAVREEAEARITKLVHALTDDPRVARVLFIEQLGVSPRQEARRRQAHLGFARYLSNVVTSQPVQSLRAQRRRDTIALGLVGAINEVLANWILLEDHEPLDELTESLVEMVLIVHGALHDG